MTVLALFLSLLKWLTLTFQLVSDWAYFVFKPAELVIIGSPVGEWACFVFKLAKKWLSLAIQSVSDGLLCFQVC